MLKEIQWLYGLFAERYFSIKRLGQIFRCDFIFLELPKWAEQLLGLRFSFALIVNRCILLLFLPRMGTFLVWISAIWVYIPCVVARSSFCPSLALYWGPPRICIHKPHWGQTSTAMVFHNIAMQMILSCLFTCFFSYGWTFKSQTNSQTVSHTYRISCAPISSLLFISDFTPSL